MEPTRADLDLVLVDEWHVSLHAEASTSAEEVAGMRNEVEAALDRLADELSRRAVGRVKIN